jgi:hypothetical protein
MEKNKIKSKVMKKLNVIITMASCAITVLAETACYTSLGYTECVWAGEPVSNADLPKGGDWSCPMDVKENYVSSKTAITTSGSGKTTTQRGCRMYVTCSKEGYEDIIVYGPPGNTNYDFPNNNCEVKEGHSS